MSGDESAHPDAGRRRGHRRLTEDEEHLWSVVARTIKPLRHAKKIAAARHKAPTPEAAGSVARPSVRSVKKKAVDAPAATPRQHAPPAPISIVRRERQHLARGRAAIDGRLDLHGMTQAQAHDALMRFLHRSQARGAKFVLVITGKGSPTARPDARGILRRQVPLWLGLPELRACVLGFDVAHVGHGGEGALYVRLKKARS
jgi:DNA-nicking Smr family endonuclease